MSGLLFLTQDDFTIKNGTKGKLLCHSIKGISILFFYSTKCEYCQKFIPVYKTLPGNIKGCHFGMVNVSQNSKLINMSRETISEIKYVPYIVLYVDGKPYVRYDGPYDAKEVAQFVMEINQRLNAREQFVTSNGPNDKIKQQEKSIPAYCVGTPISERVSYLAFDSAYDPMSGKGGASASASVRVNANDYKR